MLLVQNPTTIIKSLGSDIKSQWIANTRSRRPRRCFYGSHRKKHSALQGANVPYTPTNFPGSLHKLSITRPRFPETLQIVPTTPANAPFTGAWQLVIIALSPNTEAILMLQNASEVITVQPIERSVFEATNCL